MLLIIGFRDYGDNYTKTWQDIKETNFLTENVNNNHRKVFKNLSSSSSYKNYLSA